MFFVDDDDGMCKLISKELERINCNVSCFTNGADCLEQLGKQNCDLLITDVRMPGMDGLTLLNRVRRVAPWVSVIVTTGFGDISMSVRALQLGAVEFIEKPLDQKGFFHKVKAVLEHDDFTNNGISQPLTKMEKRVLKLLLEGMYNKEIAYKLGRTMRSVELYRRRLKDIFGVDSTVDLIKKALGKDLIDVE